MREKIAYFSACRKCPFSRWIEYDGNFYCENLEVLWSQDKYHGILIPDADKIPDWCPLEDAPDHGKK